MRKRAGLFIIIAGILLISYPFISNIVILFNQSSAILNYQETVSNMTEEELEAEKEKMQQYNEQLTQNSITIDGEEDDTTTDGVSYLNVLDIGDVIGYVSIPIIDVYLPIYHGTSDEVLEAGVGHLEESSFPIGQVGTHAVFLGHTGLVRTKMFDDLDKMELGDKFYIYILDEKYTYEVDQIEKVYPDEISDYTQIYEDQEYVTLVTCTPYGINTHRLLVRGTRVEDAEEENYFEEDSNVLNNRIKLYKLIFIVIIFIIILILIIFLILKIRKNKLQKKGKHDS